MARRLNSRQKGARIERAAAAYLRELGFSGARRGVQYHGGPDSPDVADAIPGVHIECKGVERLNIWEALKQSWEESGAAEVPVVMFKRNRSEWYVALPMGLVEVFALRLLGALDYKVERSEDDGNLRAR